MRCDSWRQSPIMSFADAAESAQAVGGPSVRDEDPARGHGAVRPDAPGAARNTPGGWLGLLRPGNALLSALAVAVGAVAALGAAPILLEPVPLALAALVGFTGTAYGNTLNDLFDHKLDLEAHPDRPLPQGRATRMAAWNLTLLLWLITITVAALVDTAFLLLVVGLMALLFVYEQALKNRGLVGNLAVAIAAGSLFPLGALAYDAPLGIPLVLGLIAAFAHLGRELQKDSEDAYADRTVRTTFAVRHSPQAAARLGALFLATAVAVSPLPHFAAGWGDLFLVLLVPTGALFLGAARTGTKDPARGRALAKMGMVAAMVAFLVGALT